MKIGLISFHSFLKPGGVKTHILGLHQEFKKRGIESKIIAPRRSRSENYGRDVVLLGTSFPVNFNGTQTDFCVNFNPLSLDKALKKEKFDILHFHNFGIPSSLQFLERSPSLNILTFHANIERSEFLKKFPVFFRIFKKIVKWKMDGIIGVAPLNLKVFKDYSGPKTVIPNGINIQKFSLEAQRIGKFADGKTNILFVGRIEKRKGLIYLLKAYEILTKKFSNLRLIVVGEGNAKKDCQLWVKSHNLKEVYFEGEASDKELHSYYGSSDIFVSPAIFGESFGIVLLEAMASGLPVAAFANKGYKQFLKGKRMEEFLARPKDFESLAEKIEILIKDEGLRKKMGEWGRFEAKNYSWGKVTDRILDFYKLCQESASWRKKQEKKNFSMDKILNKIYNKDILDWLKPK
ncbi:glycosyltransferase family 4 protein [Patescibacteria group bacterium]